MKIVPQTTSSHTAAHMALYHTVSQTFLSHITPVMAAATVYWQGAIISMFILCFYLFMWSSSSDTILSSELGAGITLLCNSITRHKVACGIAVESQEYGSLESREPMSIQVHNSHADLQVFATEVDDGLVGGHHDGCVGDLPHQLGGQSAVQASRAFLLEH